MAMIKKELRELIRKEQIRNTQIETIRNELIKAEGRGFTTKTPQGIMQEVIKRL